MQPTGKNCGNCAACINVPIPHDIRGQLECHAAPPQMIVMPVMTVKGLQATAAAGWPVVQAEQWCGEWREKPVIAAANH